MESLERLKELHADLVAHTQQSLTDLNRLSQELQDSIADFRSLLDKVNVTQEEVRQYNNGEIEVAGTTYKVNEDFRHLSSAIGTALDIPEEYAGRLIIETQSPDHQDVQATINDVVSKYHDRRDYLLQDLRLILQQSTNLETGLDAKEMYGRVLHSITEEDGGRGGKPDRFAQRCIEAMGRIEVRQAQLNEQIQSKAILNQARGEAFYQTLEFQRSSLFKQHEALGAILALLFKTLRTGPEHLRKLHEISRKWQRLDFHWIHYLPAFDAAFLMYGSIDGNTSPQEALQLNHIFAPTIKDGKFVEDANGPYRPLAATLELWWTAKYSSFYRESAAPDNAAGVREKIMKRALDDGGLEFMLSVCVSMRRDPWQPSARQELVDMLLDGSNITFEGVEQTSSYFSTMIMEAYESFAECWITNMPDSIRDLKKEEDDRRLLQITAGSDGLLQRPPRDQGVRLHLEAFLVVIAFAFEGRPDEAEQFWADPDGNLYGFVQWASRRQTVPRVSAFCEMLCAISELSTNAQAAHKFLLEDSVSVPSMRHKKLPSMSYQQIFAELDFYARKVHEKAQASQVPKSRQHSEPELNELESPIMLACYLRLLGHLCKQTSHTREFVLGMTEFDLPRSLLALSSGSIPSYLRAGIFLFFEALLTDKSSVTSNLIWTAIEEWASTTHDRAISTASDKQPPPTLTAVKNTLAAVTASYDQYDAFVRLMVALVRPLPKEGGQPLPFPPDLGSNYRYPGIVPYIDLVCGQLTAKNVTNWLEDGNPHGIIRLVNAFDFIVACLTSFNEGYVIALDKASPRIPNDEDFYMNYVQRHPFARVMQWIFSTNTIKCLTDLLHQPIEAILEAASDEPKVVSLQRLLEVLNCVISLQPTYFDMLKPKLKAPDGYKSIQYSGINAIEDTVIAHPELLLDLCQYAATEHVPLSLCSLEYLQRLAESARFQHHLFDESKRDRSGRRMIELIGPVGEAKLKHISSSLSERFQINLRELEAGIESNDYRLKDGLLSFFNACLSTHSESPNIAHLLLGFERIGNYLGLTEDFEQGRSMFDCLTSLSINFPHGIQYEFEGWLMHIKAESMCALQHAWASPVSSDLVMIQLRRSNFLVDQFLQEPTVSQATLWDGKSVFDKDFYDYVSAETFTDFLAYRKHLFEYIAREVQYVAKEKIITLQEKYTNTLQGKSLNADGFHDNHATVFDMFDFAELDTGETEYLATPDLKYFHNIDFDAYARDGLYELHQVHLVLDERSAAIAQEHNNTRQTLDADELLNEASGILLLLEARNRHTLAKIERIACLHNYVGMIVTIVNCLPMEASVKTQFILRMLQLILPKLDTYLSEGTPEAVELIRMADTLLFELSSIEKPSTSNVHVQKDTQTRVDVTISEKLFQLFRICAEGVPLSATNPDLRAGLYSICAQYLTRILSPPASSSESSKKARSNAMDTVRSAGPQLTSILSDDADDGVDTCRLNALNFLSQLVNLARQQQSNLLIEAFIKSNILEVLLDPIKNVAQEFQGTDPSNRSHLTTLFEARTHLLLHVSRTRPGASALIDANLIQTLRDSMIFAADPDLGFDLNTADPTALFRSANPSRSTANGNSSGGTQAKTALTTYFSLLASLLRLLLSTFISFGPENEKMIYMIRTFLQDYRGNMVGVFKRAAGLNLAAQQSNQSFLGGSVLNANDMGMRKYVDECLAAYTGLAVGCGFMEFEDEMGLGGNGIATAGLGRSTYTGGGFT